MVQDNDQQHPPDDNAVPSFASRDETDEEADSAASEAPDINPVFGSTTQPQEVFDAEIVGTTSNHETAIVDDGPTNFDPENDPRMQAHAD